MTAAARPADTLHVHIDTLAACREQLQIQLFARQSMSSMQSVLAKDLGRHRQLLQPAGLHALIACLVPPTGDTWKEDSMCMQQELAAHPWHRFKTRLLVTVHMRKGGMTPFHDVSLASPICPDARLCGPSARPGHLSAVRAEEGMRRRSSKMCSFEVVLPSL